METSLKTEKTLRKPSESQFNFLAPKHIKRYRKFKLALTPLDLNLARIKRFYLKEIEFSENTNIGWHQFPRITLPYLKKFIKVVQNSNKVESLKLKLPHYISFVDIKLLFLPRCFSQLTYLKKLTFDFQKFMSFSDAKAKNVATFIKRLGHLRTFKIHTNFMSSEKIVNSEIRTLSKAFKKISCLENIHINFHSGDITDVGVNEISRALKRRRTLKRIHLNFSGREKITDEGLENILKVLKAKKHLESLVLELRWAHITNIGVLRLGEELKGLKGLKTAGFSFSWSNINGDSDFLLNLRDLPKLENISFKLGRFNNIKDLSFAFSTFAAQMQSLHLCFQWHEITNQGMEFLSKALEKFSSLQNINLTFDSSITGQGLVSLGDALKTLKEVKSIELHFQSFGITCQGLVYIGNALKTLKDLRELTLEVSSLERPEDHQKISTEKASTLSSLNFFFDEYYDGILETLSPFLRSVPSLQEITIVLNSHKDKGIYDQGIQSFFQALTTLPILKNIDIKFYYCAFLTKNGLKNILPDLKKLTSLQSLYIYFEYCPKITWNEKLYFSKIFNQLPCKSKGIVFDDSNE